MNPNPSSPPEFPIRARGRCGWDEIADAAVINPGGACGRLWRVYVDGQVEPPPFIVEALSCEKAEDAFVSSGADLSVRITPDSPEADDYGWQETQEVRVLNATTRTTVWTTLSGKTVTDPAQGKYISEPKVTGDGIYYDSDPIRIDELEPNHDLRYFGAGLPAGGVTPQAYALPPCCKGCGEFYYPGPDDDGYCSRACGVDAVDADA